MTVTKSSQQQVFTAMTSDVQYVTSATVQAVCVETK